MTRSESINELAGALAKAQSEMEGAKKGHTNPAFRSKYADLSAVRDATVAELTANGLAVAQFPRLVSAGEGAWLVEVETCLMHTSGQWMTDTLAVPVTKVDAQGVGSAITYARRYSLLAITGIAPQDDDGNAAVGAPAQARQETVKPAGFDAWLADIEAVADEGVSALEVAWKASRGEFRTYLMNAHAQKWDAIKAKAKAPKKVVAS